MEIASTTAHPHAAACWQWPGHLIIVRAVAAGGPASSDACPLKSSVWRSVPHAPELCRKEGKTARSRKRREPVRTRAAEAEPPSELREEWRPRSECFGSDAPTMRREPYGSLSFSAAGAKVHHSQLALPFGGQRSNDSRSEMRNSSNDLRHLSFVESARRSSRIFVEAVLVNNK